MADSEFSPRAQDPLLLLLWWHVHSTQKAHDPEPLSSPPILTNKPQETSLSSCPPLSSVTPTLGLSFSPQPPGHPRSAIHPLTSSLILHVGLPVQGLSLGPHRP